MSLCLLNSLPVELIHHLLEYFHSYEIIQSFFNVNEHLNRIVINYDRYIWDFRGILKCQFDLVCQFLQPNRVIYLRLCDDDETPEQCHIFFSRFHIEQFVNLRSLEIISHRKNIEPYLTDLSKLSRLSSIILSLTHRITSIVSIQRVFPQLHRLIIDSPEFLNIKMPELRYLKLTKYERAPFSYLSSNLMPNLHSLDITLSLSSILSTMNSDLIWFQIKRLFLKTTDSDISFSMSQFLCKLINLKHLEIDVQKATNVPDGQQWESLVSHLIRFDFRFTIYNQKLDNDTLEKYLKSFCSSFWLEEKRWFVGYYKNLSSDSFFTLPRFVPTSIDTSSVYQPLSTSSNFSFDQYIRCITILQSFSYYDRFNELTSLIFGGKFDFNSKSQFFLKDLLQRLPHVHSLSLQNSQSTLYILNNSILNQIRSLTIRHTSCRSQFQLSIEPKKWCDVFPRVERLFVSIDMTRDMFIFIDELKYLSIATFEINDWGKSRDWSNESTREWIRKSSQRLRKDPNFTLLYSNEEIHFWMNEQQVNDFH
ncbi:unnamed protein product [Adineta ricciae]|uniref:F-box domain-containing protein n=1 Tax=Adineta ricciae TaxID=249248 RepID=A0A815BXR3_ADIRI|nr:unnamed protein product [Adineta ricciae]